MTLFPSLRGGREPDAAIYSCIPDVRSDEFPRLPLEGKLSAQLTDEVSIFFSTSSATAFAVPPVSLRLGHAAALTCPRHVIHPRGDAPLPSRGRLRSRQCEACL